MSRLSNHKKEISQSFDKYNDSYDEELAKNLSKIPFHDNIEYYAEHKIQILKEICPYANSILESGCGIGRNIKFIQKYYPGSEIAGADVSNTCLAEAKSSYPDIDFFLPENIPLNTYDLLLIADVIHHISPNERKMYLNSLKQHLKNVAEIVIFEQNPYNPLTRYLVNTCPFDEEAELISAIELVKLLNDVGFAVNLYSYCFFFPSSFHRINHLENWLAKIPLGGKYYIHAYKFD